MNKLLSAILAFGLSSACLLAQHPAPGDSEPAKIAGDWQLSMDSPHGPMRGPLKIEQDGSKFTAIYEVEDHGTLRFTGTVHGNSVVFELQRAEMTFKMTGTVEGDKMSGATSMNDGAWKATRL